jgi:hypothetical protein
MCETPNRPQSPLSRAVAVRWLGCADGHPSGYREPFEELWWTAAPAAWRALNSNAAARVPEVTDLRLRRWIAEVTSENPVAALALVVLDQAYRDFTILRSSCSTYSVVPADAAQSAICHRYRKTERGHALAVRNAQDCGARIACALSWRGRSPRYSGGGRARARARPTDLRDDRGHPLTEPGFRGMMASEARTPCLLDGAPDPEPLHHVEAHHAGASPVQPVCGRTARVRPVERTPHPGCPSNRRKQGQPHTGESMKRPSRSTGSCRAT